VPPALPTAINLPRAPLFFVQRAAFLNCEGSFELPVTSFIPNGAYIHPLFPSIYFMCAQRVKANFVRLMNTDWTSKSFDLRRGAIGRAVFGEPGE